MWIRNPDIIVIFVISGAPAEVAKTGGTKPTPDPPIAAAPAKRKVSETPPPPPAAPSARKGLERNAAMTAKHMVQVYKPGLRSESALIRILGRLDPDAHLVKIRFGGSKKSCGGPRTFTMGSWKLKMEPLESLYSIDQWSRIPITLKRN